MQNVERLEGNDLGVGMSADEIRSVARRQFAASVVVAIVIALAAGLMALKPAYRDTADSAQHKYAGVQQPSFAAGPGQHIAGLKQNAIELP
jgi:hypothetical protein